MAAKVEAGCEQPHAVGGGFADHVFSNDSCPVRVILSSKSNVLYSIAGSNNISRS